MQIKNQIATYNVGINSTKPNKDEALTEVKNKTDVIVKAFKEYGLAEDDIQTTSMSIYQREEPYYEDGIQKFKKTDWTANTSVSAVLRDISKVQDFSDKIYALNVSDLNGPYFSLDYNANNDTEILRNAIAHVEEKARILAKEKHKILGELMAINEEDPQGNTIMLSGLKMMGGGGAGGAGGMQPGVSTVTKSVSMTFRLY